MDPLDANLDRLRRATARAPAVTPSGPETAPADPPAEPEQVELAADEIDTVAGGQVQLSWAGLIRRWLGG